MRRGRNRLAHVGVLSLLAVGLVGITPSTAGAAGVDARTNSAVASGSPATVSGVEASPAVEPGATYAFPSADSVVVASTGFIDDVQVGYFWSSARGDSVSETFAGPRRIKRAVLDVEVVENFLNNGAQVDWDIVINGKVVGKFTVSEGEVGPIKKNVTFPRIRGGEYDVTIRVTNEVAAGEGSHSLAYAGDFEHSIKLKRS